MRPLFEVRGHHSQRDFLAAIAGLLVSDKAQLLCRTGTSVHLSPIHDTKITSTRKARLGSGGSEESTAYCLRRQAESPHFDVASVDVLACLDDIFEVEPALGTLEAAGAAAVHDGMLAASVDL